jgi:hypothetical protein
MNRFLWVIILITGSTVTSGQTKVSADFNGFQGFIGFGGLASFALDLEHKFDLNYGMSIGLKYTIYTYGFDDALTGGFTQAPPSQLIKMPWAVNPYQPGTKSGSNVTVTYYYAVPVGFFFYSSPKLRFRLLFTPTYRSNKIIYEDDWADYSGATEFSSQRYSRSQEYTIRKGAIKNSFKRIDLDVGFEVSYFLTRRLRVGSSVGMITLLTQKRYIDLTFASYDLSTGGTETRTESLLFKPTHFSYVLSGAYTLFRIRTKRL